MSKGDEQGKGGGQDKPGGGGGGGPKKIMVSVTSLDANIEHHPFDANDTVGDVHSFAYDRIVRQRDQITFERTWLELNKERLDDSRVLSTLASPSSGGGSEPDLVLSLTWDTSGG